MKSEFEVRSQFAAALESRGIIPPQPLLSDGQRHRCDVQGKHGKNDAVYVLYLDAHPAGGFENYRDGLGWQTWKLEADAALSAEETQALRKKFAVMKKAREADVQQRQTEAGAKASRIWSQATDAPANHPYLVKKEVSPAGLKVYRDALVIPIRDTQGTLHSLQFINGAGEKRFLSGGRKQGGFHLIGQPQPNGPLCVAEGVATALSLFEATAYPVAVAFDAGNLKDVAQALRTAYPHCPLIVCADDDHQTPGNPGLTKATEAAKAVRGLLAVPEFRKPRPDWATDFNDLARLSGAMSVAIQIDSAAAPDAEALDILCLEDVVAEPVRWLWPGRFALGKLSLVAGYPGLGKSQLTAALAAVVTTGGTWPVTGERYDAPADVLFLSAEDDAADTIKPRLQAAGADLRRCRIIGSVHHQAHDPKNPHKRRCFNLADDLALLERALVRYPYTRLVVVDPLSAYMGDSRKVDTHRASDVRGILAPLVELACARRVAVLGIFHLNKREGSSAMDRINGSGAFVAAARAVWLVAKDKGDKRHRVFVQVKNNLAIDQDGLKFEIQGTEINTPNGPVATSALLWHSERITMDADEALDGLGSATTQKSVLDEVMAFLEELLADGPKFAKDIFAAADEENHSRKSLYRAKETLGIVASKERGKHGVWQWALPNKDGQDGQDGQDNHLDF